MSINFHPKPGQILMCDFSQGFKVPEMVKKRPVIILTGAILGRSSLVTVIPLSTTEPKPQQLYHCKIPKQSMPMIKDFHQDCWVKGDIICTVGFHRLDLIRLGKRRADGKREYFTNKLGREKMKQIFNCILHGLNLGYLNQHLE